MDEEVKPIFNLRSLKAEDVPELFSLTIKNKDYLGKFLNWLKADYKIDDTVKFISESIQKEKEGKMLIYAVMMENKIVGIVDLHAINQDKNAEIGYWVDQDMQGKGIATNATKIIIKEGFEKLNLQRIGLRCAVENTKSSAIPKRLGFTKEGVLRQATFCNNRFLDMEIWSLLTEEWEDEL